MTLGRIVTATQRSGGLLSRRIRRSTHTRVAVSVAVITLIGAVSRTAITAPTRVDLGREFENPSPALKTVASRRSRGVYKRDRRPSEPTVVDSRGRMVRAVGKTQTFLRAVQVDELVALYWEGATLVELGERFSVHRRTVAAHLVRRSVPTRRGGLAEANVAEAVELYTGGLTLMEVGRRFGVSQQAVRRALAAEGVAIRPAGRRSRVSACRACRTYTGGSWRSGCPAA